MRHSVAGRVQRLEVHFRPRPTKAHVPSAEDLLLYKTVEELLQNMDPKYSHLAFEDLKRPPSQWSDLTLAVGKRVLDHLRQNRPLAFPDKIAEIYVNRKVTSETRCRACGYSVPAASFKACPICGGRLDWPAYSAEVEPLGAKARPESGTLSSAPGSPTL